eukprot:scaffold103260_cov24-Tisochrysis_lutea.AAC.1
MSCDDDVVRYHGAVSYGDASSCLSVVGCHRARSFFTFLCWQTKGSFAIIRAFKQYGRKQYSYSKIDLVSAETAINSCPKKSQGRTSMCTGLSSLQAVQL